MSITAKIAALRAKTTSAGCTEAEALAAAELAARLMRDHGLAEEDLVYTQAEAVEDTTRTTWRTTLAHVISVVTNTSAQILVGHRRSEIIFVGRAPGPEIALYLRDVLWRAVAAEQARFKGTPAYRKRRTTKTRRQAAGDFTDALVQRLAIRLAMLFEPSMSRELRLAAAAERDRRFAGGREVAIPSRRTRFADATFEGDRAGQRIPINPGVAGDDELKAIGGQP